MTGRRDQNPLALHQGANALRDEAYASVLDRVVHRVQERAHGLYRDFHQAKVALEELLSQPLSRRYLLVRNSARYRSWFLGHRLLQYSAEKWFTAPEEALEVADLVRFAAHHLHPSESKGITEDLRSRAWAYRGNCLRILGDLVGAEAAFEVAKGCRRRGTGDAMLEACSADLEASLRSAQGRHEDALGLLRRAFGVFTRAGDLHQQGRNLIGQGKVHLDLGNVSTAEWHLRRGLRWIDTALEPRLVLVARHNLVCCALAAGDLRRARTLLEAWRGSYQREEGRVLEERLRHLDRMLKHAPEGPPPHPRVFPSAAPEEGEERRTADPSSSALRVGFEMT